MRTEPLLAGGRSNQSGSAHTGHVGSEFDSRDGESEFDGGDEADTESTGDSATSTIGGTSDGSEDWELRSAGSAWSL